MNADAVVIGAGIVGAACAAELAAQGMTVEVLDTAGIGGGATAAGMGHIVVMNDSPAELALSRYSRELWLALAPSLRSADAFSRCGTLWVAADAEEWAAACALRHALAGANVDAELLDAATLRECEPALAVPMAGALLVPDDAIVYAPRTAQWLLEHSLGARNIRVRSGCEVTKLASGEARLANGEVVHGGLIVVANGLFAQRLVPWLPIVPKKGHLLITDRYPDYLHHQVLELGYIKSAHQTQGASVAFNAQPRPTGQVLLGSSRQFDTIDPAVEWPVLARMIERAARYLPAFSSLNAIRAWTGFRAATPDGLPIIGPAGDALPGVWVAAGHEGLGVTTSLATAKLLAAQIAGTRAAIDAAPYRVDRFAAEASDGA
ncbi:NAD(P)/FAD-dependent oxidoreductase [Trinickia acidisoli]|uniref:NAD(P)/FAD-dependent oxidoreductase n=1 Tax=Trinickia acidisoli TaxID=2767482 RepID=UPI001A8F138D|nr:FAD-binding oxidoreductase [Trinickia acidisoli]